MKQEPCIVYSVLDEDGVKYPRTRLVRRGYRSHKEEHAIDEGKGGPPYLGDSSMYYVNNFFSLTIVSRREASILGCFAGHEMMVWVLGGWHLRRRRTHQLM